MSMAVSLDRLYYFAAYLEQSIVFGHRDEAVRREIESELSGNNQSLSKVDIWRITQHILANSSFTIGQPEVEALYKLQEQKDLYGMLRSIVLVTHQQTGALTGRIGVHSRIAAETEANAATNIEAVLQIMDHIQPGNRLIIMDMVKATADEQKLRAPDIFETDVYGQHRNGLIDNHAWNLQKLVRTIRSRNYQDGIALLIRLDGPDEGANVNPFRATSLEKYRLAIAKLIRYLEAVLPDTPFKLVLGNEPDLPYERPWSDPEVDPYRFIVEEFAPPTGNFMKGVAAERPDVAFLCPALSLEMKRNQLDYYTAFFGSSRPENLVPAMHGYGDDVVILPGDPASLLEQQAEILRLQGRFEHISCTEVGSEDPFIYPEGLSDRGRFDDVVIWLLLSTEHRAPPGQSNTWSFRLNPAQDDPTARRLADVVNRSQDRVLRNIQERGGSQLQIVRNHPSSRPAYGVEYLDHNMPATMTAGQAKAVQITVLNTSYRTWPVGGSHPIRLGYHWYTSSGAEVPASLWDDNRTELPYDLLPGASVSLTANLGPPRSAGAYEVRWDMVEELRTWFAWQGVPTLNAPVTVTTEQQPPAGGLRLSASHNNRQQGEDNLQQAIDDNLHTRWSSRQPQRPGMWFQIDLGEVRRVSHLRLNNDFSPNDYPRGYVVRVSLDGQQWSVVAQVPQNDQPLNVIFNSRQVRFIRIEQTGSDPVYWWSIHHLDISDEAQISARASHNNIWVGADSLSQALDGRPETRWSSRAVQQPGMWFELDLNQIRTVSGLALDTAGSPNDYPRGYVVRVSTDRSQWQEVARRERNDRALDIIFSSRPARYIYIEQTGQSDRWWWSIHQATVKFDPTALILSARASHNNVLVGADSLSQALDGRPETRWSSRAIQQPGMWFELDLNQMRTVSGLALDTAGSPNDYPRGYIVRVSTDRSQWQEVARRDSNDRALDITFSSRPVRYIYIEQTGQADRWWWSIHRVTIK